MNINDLPLFSNINREIAEQFSLDAQIVLYPGDVENLLDTIPPGKIRLIITSPPYNLGKEYETRVGLRTYLQSQQPVIEKLVRVLAPNGSICWQVGNFIENGEVFPLDIFYYDIFKDLGLYLRNRIVWHFGHGLHARKRFSGRYETLLWFTKSDDYVFNLDAVRVPQKYPGKRHFKGPNKGKLSGNPKGKNPSDFWEILYEEWESAILEIPNVKSNHPEKTSHPCQFPIELVERCVLALTNPDDWVLDPYAGVGSSLIATIKNGRRAIGAEREENYISITQDRLQKFLNGILPIRPIGKKIFKPTGKERVAKIPEEWKQYPDGNS